MQGSSTQILCTMSALLNEKLQTANVLVTGLVSIKKETDLIIVQSDLTQEK